MKKIQSTLVLLAAAFFGTTSSSFAQDLDSVKKEDKGDYLSLSTDGIRYSTRKRDDKNKSNKITMHWGLMDLGLNMLQDKSQYGVGVNAQSTKYGVQEDWFDLKNGRSWNVNLNIATARYKVVSNENFKVNLYGSLGLQIYNFRYATSVTQHSDPKDKFTMDATKYSKNKLSVNYLYLPLMVNFNHRIDKNTWLTYGFGGSVGYKINAWTKQQSSDFGKVKNHDLFNINDFNFNLIGEVGVGPVRLFGSYQVTNFIAQK